MRDLRATLWAAAESFRVSHPSLKIQPIELKDASAMIDDIGPLECQMKMLDVIRLGYPQIFTRSDEEEENSDADEGKEEST